MNNRDSGGRAQKHASDQARGTIFDAAERYQQAGQQVIILAGKDYGSGSSRDWAAKGPLLQGVRAIICKSFERIHRSNLVGMGIVPLCFANANEDASEAERRRGLAQGGGRAGRGSSVDVRV